MKLDVICIFWTCHLLMGWEIIYSIYWPPSPPGQRKRCFWTWGPTGSCSSCRATCTPAQWCWAWSCCCTFCQAPPSEGDLKKACLQVPGWNAAPRAWTSWWVSVWPSPGDRVPPVNEHLPGLRGLQIACCSVTLTWPLPPPLTSFFRLLPTWPHCSSDAGDFFPLLKVSLTLSFLQRCFPKSKHQHGSLGWVLILCHFLQERRVPCQLGHLCYTFFLFLGGGFIRVYKHIFI